MILFFMESHVTYDSMVLYKQDIGSRISCAMIPKKLHVHRCYTLRRYMKKQASLIGDYKALIFPTG